jgi:hypothetical protein
MNLPQITIDRIEKEADAFAEKKQDEITGHYNTYHDLLAGYEAGATAEAIRALPLYEALRVVLPYLKAEGTNGNHWVKVVEAVLASYESGEPVEPEEPLLPFTDARNWNDREKTALVESTMRITSQTILNSMKMLGISNHMPCIVIDEETGIPYEYSLKRIGYTEEPVQGKEARQKDPNPLTREALEIELWSMLGDECEKILLPLKETWLDSVMVDIDSYCDGREGKEAKEFAEWILKEEFLLEDGKWWRNAFSDGKWFTTEDIYQEWQQSLKQLP